MPNENENEEIIVKLPDIPDQPVSEDISSTDRIDGRNIIRGTIRTTSLVVGNQFWIHNLTWTATDLDTASWSSGTLTFTNGDDYSISSGNTGNMAATTYIYFDKNTSLTVLQTSTTYSDAVGDSKALLAIATNQAGAGSKCLISPVFSEGTTISGDSIVTGTITLTSTGTNLVVASGALELNPGADVKLYSSAGDTAAFALIDQVTPANQIYWAMAQSTGTSGIVPTGAYTGTADFGIGDSTRAFNIVSLQVDNTVQVVDENTALIANFPKASAAYFKNGITIPIAGLGKEIEFIGNASASIVANSGANTFYIKQLANSGMRLRTNDTDRITIEASGDVGLGNTSPSHQLDVAGSVRLTGALRGVTSTNPLDLLVGGSAWGINARSVLARTSYSITPADGVVIAASNIVVGRDTTHADLHFGNDNNDWLRYSSGGDFQFVKNSVVSSSILEAGELQTKKGNSVDLWTRAKTQMDKISQSSDSYSLHVSNRTGNGRVLADSFIPYCSKYAEVENVHPDYDYADSTLARKAKEEIVRRTEHFIDRVLNKDKIIKNTVTSQEINDWKNHLRNEKDTSRQEEEIIRNKRVSKIPFGTVLEYSNNGVRPTQSKGQMSTAGIHQMNVGFSTEGHRVGINVAKFGSSVCRVKGKCKAGDFLQTSNIHGVAEVISPPVPFVAFAKAKENKNNVKEKLIEVDLL